MLLWWLRTQALDSKTWLQIQACATPWVCGKFPPHGVTVRIKCVNDHRSSEVLHCLQKQQPDAPACTPFVIWPLLIPPFSRLAPFSPSIPDTCISNTSYPLSPGLPHAIPFLPEISNRPYPHSSAPTQLTLTILQMSPPLKKPFLTIKAGGGTCCGAQRVLRVLGTSPSRTLLSCR